MYFIFSWRYGYPHPETIVELMLHVPGGYYFGSVDQER